MWTLTLKILRQWFASDCNSSWQLQVNYSSTETFCVKPLSTFRIFQIVKVEAIKTFPLKQVLAFIKIIITQNHHFLNPEKIG